MKVGTYVSVGPGSEGDPYVYLSHTSRPTTTEAENFQFKSTTTLRDPRRRDTTYPSQTTPLPNPRVTSPAPTRDPTSGRHLHRTPPCLRTGFPP